jgi:hypothetical protein
MKHSLSFFSRFCVVLLAAATMASCTQEELIDNNTPNDGEETTFTINVPGTATVSASRAITGGGDADNRIDDLILLLFPDADQGKFVDAILVEGTDIAPGDAANTRKVIVKIPRGEYHVAALANFHDHILAPVNPSSQKYKTFAEFKAFCKGKNLSEINEILYHGMPRVSDDVYWWETGAGAANFRPFVMGGYCNIPTSRMEDITLNLFRDMAKINIDASAVKGKFDLREVQVRNIVRGTPPKMMALPPRGEGDLSMYEELEKSGRKLSHFDPKHLNPKSEDPYGTGLKPVTTFLNNSLIDEIFIPETRLPQIALRSVLPGGDYTDPRIDDFLEGIWRESLAVLIQADLGGSTGVRWFRVNLRLPDTDDYDEDDNTTELKHVNILRNHSYTINITGIAENAIGYATADEAYNALPGDLILDLVVDDPELTHIVYNGQYYLATNELEVFKSWESITGGYQLMQNLKIFTDYPGGWKIEKVEYADNGTDTDTDWIRTVFPTAATVTSMKPSVQEVAVKTNHGPAKRRTATLTITAGTLSTTVTVQQKAGGVLASPGVIGVGMESGKLTLSGSREYKDTPIEEHSEFGPLAGETVYMTYFKGGSLIAIGGERGDGDAFHPSDIVGAPSIEDGYIGLDAWRSEIGNNWEKVPFAASYTQWNFEPEKGLGDPCVYYFEGFNDQNWILPIGGYANGGWNGGSFGNNRTNNEVQTIDWEYANATWMTRAMVDDQLKPGLPVGAHPGRDNAPDWSMFLPIAGNIDLNGALDSPSTVCYWSSTLDNVNKRSFYSLSLASTIRPNDTKVSNYGFSVRCVKVPPPTLTVTPKSVEFEWNQTTVKPVNVTTDSGIKWRVVRIEAVAGNETDWIGGVAAGDEYTGNKTLNVYPKTSYTYDAASPDPRAVKVVLEVVDYPFITTEFEIKQKMRPKPTLTVDPNKRIDSFRTIVRVNVLGTNGAEDWIVDPAYPIPDWWEWNTVNKTANYIEFYVKETDLFSERSHDIHFISPSTGVPGVCKIIQSPKSISDLLSDDIYIYLDNEAGDTNYLEFTINDPSAHWRFYSQWKHYEERDWISPYPYNAEGSGAGTFRIDFETLLYLAPGLYQSRTAMYRLYIESPNGYSSHEIYVVQE